MRNHFMRFMSTSRRRAALKIMASVAAVLLVVAGVLRGKAAIAKHALKDQSGEGYIDTAIKILLAVVLGALLLAGLYALFGDTVLPTLTRRIQEMFNYSG